MRANFWFSTTQLFFKQVAKRQKDELQPMGHFKGSRTAGKVHRSKDAETPPVRGVQLGVTRRQPLRPTRLAGACHLLVAKTILFQKRPCRAAACTWR